MAKGKKAAGWIIFFLVLALGLFCYIKFWYVFSDGTQTGELNKIAKTGYVFKTYEGVMILTGYGSKQSGTVQSNEFKFSATKEVYEELSQHTGERITVHFKKYFGTLPWRGYERSVVDSYTVDNSRIDDGPSYPEESIFL